VSGTAILFVGGINPVISMGTTYPPRKFAAEPPTCWVSRRFRDTRRTLRSGGRRPSTYWKGRSQIAGLLHQTTCGQSDFGLYGRSRRRDVPALDERRES
jgi:hypothetical protein